MPEYCPFLNRADERCSGHFNLDGLEQAFAHCFGDFAACPHHAQMTDEQAERQGKLEAQHERDSHANSPTQITISARRRGRFAAAA